MSINGCTINAFSINGLCSLRHIIPPQINTRGGAGSLAWAGHEETYKQPEITEYDYATITATLFDQNGNTVVIGQDTVEMNDSVMPMVYAHNINISEIEATVTIENIEIITRKPNAKPESN